MDYREKLIRQSNYWYNDGLKKAKMHDLSGAIVSLKKSLQLQRDNVNARNLLGLVYYGRGEVVEALVEWIISKNLKSYENIANYYIKKVQESPAELEVINQAIHKYNQCLNYCQQNGEDLAIIQLKKVIAAHPSFLKAHQLLALLYIHTEQYSKARQILKEIHKKDITNEITLSYMHELKRLHKKRPAKVQKEAKLSEEQSVTYRLGNETIIQPMMAGIKEHGALNTAILVIAGILIGASVVWFLVTPTINQERARSLNKNIITLRDQIEAQNTQIDTLKKELESYRSTSSKTENALETAEATQGSYEKLLKVQKQFDGGVTSHADMTELMLEINKKNLGDEAKKIYENIAGELFPTMCERYYDDALAKIEAGLYEEAKEKLEKVIKMDSKYKKAQKKLESVNKKLKETE